MTWFLAHSMTTGPVLEIKNAHQDPRPIHKSLHGLLNSTLCNSFISSSKLGSANYDPWAKPSPLPVVVNNV